MNISVFVEDKDIENFSDGAVKAMEEELVIYAQWITRQSAINEANVRERSAKSEITESIVRKTAQSHDSKRGWRHKTKVVVAKTTSTLSGIVFGLMANARLREGGIGYITVFSIVLILLAVSTTLQYVWED